MALLPAMSTPIFPIPMAILKPMSTATSIPNPTPTAIPMAIITTSLPMSTAMPIPAPTAIPTAALLQTKTPAMVPSLAPAPVLCCFLPLLLLPQVVVVVAVMVISDSDSALLHVARRFLSTQPQTQQTPHQEPLLLPPPSLPLLLQVLQLRRVSHSQAQSTPPKAKADPSPLHISASKDHAMVARVWPWVGSGLWACMVVLVSFFPSLFFFIIIYFFLFSGASKNWLVGDDVG